MRDGPDESRARCRKTPRLARREGARVPQGTSQKDFALFGAPSPLIPDAQASRQGERMLVPHRNGLRHTGESRIHASASTTTSCGDGAGGWRLSFGRGPAIRPAMTSTLAHSAATRQESAPARARQLRALRIWLGAIAALIVAMILVGGATRLTDSGLSITEWQPIMGARSAAQRGRLDARFRGLSEDPGIYRDQARHEPGRVQDHLLVGMGASLSRPADRRRLLRALRRLLARGLHSALRCCRGLPACSCSADYRARSAGTW